MKKYHLYAFLLGIGSLLNITPAFAKAKLGSPSDDAKALYHDLQKLGITLKHSAEKHGR